VKQARVVLSSDEYPVDVLEKVRIGRSAAVLERKDL
jgi:hypothetical protein